MNKYSEFLSEISKVATKFLMNNGGLSNGYMTYVRGRVKNNVLDTVHWSTPTVQKLTGIQVYELGLQLNNELIEVMKKNSVDECKFIAEHIEYGCYHTYATVTERNRLILI